MIFALNVNIQIVFVCPVDCFYEGENFLAINPDECIDCGVCEPNQTQQALLWLIVVWKKMNMISG